MKTVIPVAICAFLFFSCQKQCVLPEQIIGTGEIVPDALIPYINESKYNYSKEGYIINSAEENIFNLSVSYDNGQTFEPIDFAHYTVLGKHTSGSCRVRFMRNVSKDESCKKYVYTISIIQCGDCKTHTASVNWILVPKIPNDYTVEFAVKKEKSK